MNRILHSYQRQQIKGMNSMPIRLYESIVLVLPVRAETHQTKITSDQVREKGDSDLTSLDKTTSKTDISYQIHGCR